MNSNNNERLAITSHGSRFKSENKQGAAPSVTSTSSPEPRIESIGIDGSQRFSDIQNDANDIEVLQNENMGSINQGNNSESLIVFNPKKEIGS